MGIARQLFMVLALAGLAACGGGGGAAQPTPAPAPLTPSPAAAPPPAAQAFALMDPGDGAAAFASFLDMAAVDGLAIRTTWQTLEPARGSFDWSPLDSAAAAAASRGKKFGLHVIASGYAPAPSWLAGRGMQTYSWRGPTGALVTDPVPWDATLLAEWAAFLMALHDHLQSTGALARLQYISIPVPVPEMSLPGCANGMMGTGLLAYDRARYRDAWIASIGAFHASFPQVAKLLPVPVATICRPDSDGAGLYRELLGNALGLEANGFDFYATDLNALGSARMDGVAADKGRAPVVMQFIGAASADTGQSMQGSLRDAVCAGLRTYGASVLEVYKADLSSGDPAVAAGVAAIRSPASCP